APVRSFPPAPRILDIARGALPQPPSPDIRSMAGPGLLDPAHPGVYALAARIRYIQTLGGMACAVPTISISWSLHPTRADTPHNLATPESPSILCASTTERSQNLDPLNHQRLAA